MRSRGHNPDQNPPPPIFLPAVAPTTRAGPVAGEAKPTLLQLCLSLEPSFAAYHAAWEFALALHGGRLEGMARAWNVALPNKETVRELSRAERGLATRGHLRDAGRWTREFARRYFTTTAAAIRAADPNHLVLGARAMGPGVVGPHVLAACVYPAIDLALRDFKELPGDASAPVLANDVCWNDPAMAKPASLHDRRLTSIERVLRRGRAVLGRAAQHPAVVGYLWRQWQDEPGEQPPFAHGLIHVNGQEAREHTELLSDFNPRAAALHRTAPLNSIS
jgi:hypothetical protein